MNTFLQGFYSKEKFNYTSLKPFFMGARVYQIYYMHNMHDQCLLIILFRYILTMQLVLNIKIIKKYYGNLER